MSWFKFSIFVILVVTLKSSVNANAEDKNTDCGGCNQPFNHEVCDGQCLNQNLPRITMQDKFGPKVTECCDGHGYTYNDQCDVSIIQFFARTLLNFNIASIVKLSSPLLLITKEVSTKVECSGKRRVKFLEATHIVGQLYGVPHGILKVFNTILYENEFQNPQIFQHTISLSPEQCNLL
jgi:hypothetical protein